MGVKREKENERTKKKLLPYSVRLLLFSKICFKEVLIPLIGPEMLNMIGSDTL